MAVERSGLRPALVKGKTLLGLGRHSVRAQATRVAFLVAVLLLSGCSSPPAAAPPADGAATDVQVTGADGTNQTVQVAADKGVVHGTVYTNVGAVISGARVSLLRTDFFADTDSRGVFQFVNVSVGRHTLNAHASGFQAYSTEVTVEAGAVAEVEVTLTSDESVNDGYRAHVHDFWGTKNQYLLIDEDIDVIEGDPDSFTPVPAQEAIAQVLTPNRNGTADSWWTIPLLEPTSDGPPLIVPGTRWVNVTLSWDASEVTLDRIGLAYRSFFNNNVNVLGTGRNGNTWSIEINQSMADTGHQAWSLWRFWMYTENVETRGSAGLVNGPIHAKIVLGKGEVILDPPHKDYWGDANVLVLRNITKEDIVPTTCCQNRAGASSLRVDGGKLVPPGTTRMRVEFRYKYASNDGSPADFNYTLTWRTAGMNPQDTTLLDWVEMPPTLSERGRKVWEFPVSAADTDAFYQKTSQWEWKPWGKPFTEDGYWLESRARTYNLEVTVWKDAPSS